MSYTPYFSITLDNKAEHSDILVMPNGKLKSQEVTCVSKMIYVPDKLHKFVQKNSSGKFGPAVVALLEYAIARLQEDHKYIIAENVKMIPDTKV